MDNYTSRQLGHKVVDHDGDLMRQLKGSKQEGHFENLQDDLAYPNKPGVFSRMLRTNSGNHIISID